MVFGTQRKSPHATTKSTLFTVGKDEWKVRRHFRYLLAYCNMCNVFSRDLPVSSFVFSEQIKPVSLAVIELCLTEGINQTGPFPFQQVGGIKPKIFFRSTPTSYENV